MRISHLFYHHQGVEQACALNSWRSVRDWFGKHDEVIVLDLGPSLTTELPLSGPVKHHRVERIRTDHAEERSYTFGLNQVMPTAHGEWIFLWRSDYLYHRSYYPAALSLLAGHSLVLPYEALIGGAHTTPAWCAERLEALRSDDEAQLLQHAHVCPTWETRDFPHFAIRRDLWESIGGMDERLWGYGWQFPELYERAAAAAGQGVAVSFDLLAFHQNHAGSFGLGQAASDPAKAREALDGDRKLEEALGGAAAADAFRRRRNPPLRPRRPEGAYRARPAPAPAPAPASPAPPRERLREPGAPAAINSVGYWNQRFAEADWAEKGGPQQTRYFADLALAMTPPAIASGIQAGRLTVCDWGCAEGDAVAALSEAWHVPVAGADFAASAIERAQARHPGLEFMVSEGTSLPRPFDVLFSSNTLEHFDEPFEALRTLLARVRRHAILLVPFEERPLHPEHRFTFDQASFPVELAGFRLAWLRTEHCGAGPGRRWWAGHQALAVYSRIEPTGPVPIA